MEKTIDEVIQGKLDSDTEFQKTIKDLPEAEKSAKVEEKRKELLTSEFKDLSEKASKATKSEELAGNYKTRAEKAEQALKKYEKAPEQKDGEGNLSTKDTMALMEAKVPAIDIEVVTDWAKFKGISIEDALKSPQVQQTLKSNAEFRATAAATKTGAPTKTQAGEPDGAKIIESIRNAADENGSKIPEAGSPEAMAIFKARHPNFKG
jgi:hypothetical protein